MDGFCEECNQTCETRLLFAIHAGLGLVAVPDAASIEKWTKFNETGLFSVSSFPPFRKAKQMAIGTRYLVKDLKKVTLKRGEAVSI